MKSRRAVIGCAVTVTAFLVSTGDAKAQAQPTCTPDLPIHWEELTALQFGQAIEKSGGVCILPLGILEKHGPHLPLGTDLLACREVARLAAENEYAIVFPPYYFGQIFEARHQPGTVAYSEKLIFAILEETIAEIARNGIKKIILYSGHGGNEHFLPYFCQTQLASRKDYAVYLFAPTVDLEEDPDVRKLLTSTLELHAGERETSTMLAINPGLVHLDQAKAESGEDLKRLSGLHDTYTGIWWYSSFPNHYAGDGSVASAELGRLLLRKKAELLAAMIKEVKQDRAVLQLQKKFFDSAADPLGKGTKEH
jgi:creatinine amidohydrolase